jgi:hypothetical protein
MKMLLFFSHNLTEAQIADARESLGVEEFVELPQELKEKFSSVPAEVEDLGEIARDFIEFLCHKSEVGDYALIQGEFGLVYRLVEAAKALGVIPIYATTKREVIEKEKDGEVVKISRFAHVRFRKY